MRNLLIICILIQNVIAYAQGDSPLMDADDRRATIENLIAEPSEFTGPPLLPVASVVEVKWSALENLLKSNTDTTFIVNFWASWCGPCVEELPYFERLNRDFARQKVRIVLVSMDFVTDKEARVIPLVERMKLRSTVWLLNEPDANSWIERVDPAWSGALPATLILNPSRVRRSFYEKSLDYETLARELSYFVEY